MGETGRMRSREIKRESWRETRGSERAKKKLQQKDSEAEITSEEERKRSKRNTETGIAVNKRWGVRKTSILNT